MRWTGSLVAAVLLLSGLGCGRPAVVVGSKNFSEQVILGEIVAQLLEARGVSVDRKLNLGGTFICHTALESGQMDVYVEYTGTALTAILKQPVLHDPDEVYRKVVSMYRERFGIAWGPPLGFNNTYALAMRSDDAARLKIRRISDLADHVDTIRTGFGHEFLERQDGFMQLSEAYGLDFAIPPRGMELGLIYEALSADVVDLIAGNSTDGLIQKLGLTVLEDDRKFFPPYYAALVYRPEAAAEHPALEQVVELLGGSIDEAAMRSLNRKVDVERRPAAEVAREFILERAWGRSP